MSLNFENYIKFRKDLKNYEMMPYYVIFSVLLISYQIQIKKCCDGSGSDSVGRAVIFNTRRQRFESRHRQILFTINCIENTKIKKKWPGIAQ